MKKTLTIIFTALCLIALIVSVVNIGLILKENSSADGSDASYSAASSQAELKPSFDPSEHYYLMSKNYGSANELRGNVTTVIVFLNDRESEWGDNAKARYLSAHKAALREFSEQAEKAGVPLSFSIAEMEASIDSDCNIKDAYSFQPELLKVLNAESTEEYKERYIKQYPADEVSIIFAVNKEERSYGYSASASNPNLNEYSVIFLETGKFSSRNIMHEMLHQFSAEDYYYPDEIMNLAVKHFRGSIMNIGYQEDCIIDGLTAYLIGWTDKFDQNVMTFLEETKTITSEDIADARKDTIAND